jgi:hypothetical protein
MTGMDGDYCLIHVWIGRAAHTSPGANISPDALERHDGNSTGLFNEAGYRRLRRS